MYAAISKADPAGYILMLPAPVIVIVNYMAIVQSVF